MKDLISNSEVPVRWAARFQAVPSEGTPHPHEERVTSCCLKEATIKSIINRMIVSIIRSYCADALKELESLPGYFSVSQIRAMLVGAIFDSLNKACDTREAIGSRDTGEALGSLDTREALGSHHDTGEALGSPDTGEALGSPDTREALGSHDTGEALGSPDTREASGSQDEARPVRHPRIFTAQLVTPEDVKSKIKETL